MSMPVYVLSCIAGAPTTRVLSQLVRGSAAQRVSAIVPGRRRKKASARTREGVSLIHTRERLVRMGAGCSCCTVRGDLLQKVRSVAQSGSTDQLVIQVPPNTDLSVLAKTFTVPDSRGAVLGDTARLQSLIVVAKVHELRGGLPAAGLRQLAERIELAQVVLLDASDSPSPSAMAEAEQRVRALNPQATCLTLGSDAATLAQLTDTQPFDLDAAKERSELRELIQDGSSNDSSQLAFHARRPFHPERLAAWLSANAAKLMRARGTFWMASHPDTAARLDIAMGHIQTGVTGTWWAALPESERPATPHFQAHLQEIWDASFGDRRQELGFVSLKLDADALKAGLSACLLTDDELTSMESFASMPNPFQWKEAHS